MLCVSRREALMFNVHELRTPWRLVVELSLEAKNSQQARGRPRKTILRLPPAAGGTPQTPTD